MYAVIFTATIRKLDAEYSAMAEALRNLALTEFGCLQFTACAEAGQEIAVSYWDSLEQIQAWKQHPLHLQAQESGKHSWYSHYRVEVVEILRHYQSAEKKEAS